MSDKERLEEIKNNYSVGIHILSGKPSVAIPKENFEWLIEQVEKVEQLQQENEKEQKRLKNQIYKTAEEKFLLEKQLQQAQAKAERYKHALEFYADENNYVVDISEVEFLEDIPYAKPPIVYERGIKARQALESENNE